jgi:intracellular multiplication protein IcmJ
MSLLPITLGVKRSFDAKGNGGGTDKKSESKNKAGRKALSKDQMSKLVMQTLEKDNYSCRYCGFISKQYQKVIPMDWAATDLRDAEAVTACPFCEQCFMLENVGAMGSGTLIWMPEISQAALNHIMRAVYASRAQIDTAPDYVKDCADRAFEVIFNRRGEAKRRIGTDDPVVLAAALLENIADKYYTKRGLKLDGIRLMPLDKRMMPTKTGEQDQFPNIIMYYVSPEGPFGSYPVEKWEELLGMGGLAMRKNPAA